MKRNMRVPSVYDGVSQLADGVRSPSHAHQSDNTWPTFSQSLAKRPPTQHVAEIFSGIGVDLAVHGIDRGEGDQYIVIAYTGNNGSGQFIKVFDLAGDEKPVYRDTVGTAANFGYVASDGRAKEVLRFLTVQDYTFVVNRTVLTGIKNSTSSPIDTNIGHALVFIKIPAYNANYTLSYRINAVDYSHTVQTWAGEGLNGDPQAILNPDPVLAAGGFGTIRTEDVAEALLALVNADASGVVATNTLTDGSSTIELTHPSADFEWIRLETSEGNTLGLAINRAVDNFNDLPKIAPDGYVVRVRGNAKAAEDDFYVRFDADDPTNSPLGEGRWVETVAPSTSGVPVRVDLADTKMPWALIRRFDITGDPNLTGVVGGIYFTFEPLDWNARAAGDDTTNPFPSFVTTVSTSPKHIDGLFFYRDRLGVIADDRVVLSEVGRYFNFFRTTVTQLLDSDPIDIGTPESRAGRLHAAVPLSGELVLWSKTGQFALRGEPTLTPKTASIKAVSAYLNLDTCSPVPTKRGVLYARGAGAEHSALRQLFPVTALNTDFDSLDLSLHTPEYILGNASAIFSNSDEDLTIVLGDGAERYAYCFRQVVDGQERLQSAWFRWDFGAGAAVSGGVFFGAALYLVVERKGGVYLELLQTASGDTDAFAERWTYLDRRCTSPTNADDPIDEALPLTAGLSLSYDAGTGRTTVTLPFGMDSSYDLPTVVTVEGYEFADPTITTQRQFTVMGDAVSGNVYVGFKYVMEHAYERPALRRETPTGRYKPADGIHTVLGGIVTLRESAHLTVQTTAPEANGDVVWNASTLALSEGGELSLETVEVPFDVFGVSRDVRVVFYNDSPLPSNIEALEWIIDYTPSGAPAL